MDDEIKKIIEKNLPAQVGETLQKRLREAEEDKQLVEFQIDKISILEKTINDLNSNLREYEKLDERNDKLTTRENAVGIKETKQKVDELEIRLEESNKRADMVVNFTSGLVRNTNFRKTIYDSETQMPYTDSNGIYHSPMPVNKNYDENTSAE